MQRTSFGEFWAGGGLTDLNYALANSEHVQYIDRVETGGPVRRQMLFGKEIYGLAAVINLEKWMRWQYIVEVKLIGFANGLEVATDKKRMSLKWLWIDGLNNYRHADFTPFFVCLF